jgi:peptidoglycan hydrolase-like protein with peptidoglycan-binding domain
MDKGMSISRFYKSFSGTDTIAFLMFPGLKPIVIGSLTTVSYSMYRNKVPVINIGRTNINGITRGSRIYAGTMVFTLINKHWLRELQDQAPYLQDYPTLKVDELPLFDIMIVSANEYGSSCSMFIYGVDFTDESQTLSIEDLFTENIFKFVAREVSVFDENIITASGKKRKALYTVSTGVLKNYYVDEQERQAIPKNRQYETRPLNRTLYLITNGSPMMGSDIAGVQQLLNMALKRDIPITYKFDRITDQAVRDFQSTQGLIIDGVVDNGVYTKLLQYTKHGIDSKFVQVINKSGAYIYKYPDTNSAITKTLSYLASVEVFNKVTNNLEVYYQTQDGYISLYDVYSYLDNPTDAYTFEQLRYADSGPQVTILQNALSTLYPNFRDYTSGTFDEQTESYVRRFQQDNDLVETGICDNYTWNILETQTNTLYRYYVSNHADVQFSKEPGIYNITDLQTLVRFEATIINNNTQQVKCSALSIYKNGNTKTDSKVLVFKGSQTHSISEFEDMFKDDPQNLTPTDVYYFIYPYGSKPYKWHFKIKE